jgi:hypothetical protein
VGDIVVVIVSQELSVHNNVVSEHKVLLITVQVKLVPFQYVHSVLFSKV